MEDPQLHTAGVPDPMAFNPWRHDEEPPPAWSVHELQDGFGLRLSRLAVMADLLAGYNDELVLENPSTLGSMLRDECQALRLLVRRAEQLLARRGTQGGSER